jgi:hypothetical protein
MSGLTKLYLILDKQEILHQAPWLLRKWTEFEQPDTILDKNNCTVFND